MPKKSTFIKLNRKILKWRWYQDANTFRVFVHLILLANVTDRDFENITIQRGQLVTSQSHLSKDLKISVRSIRTALEHLKSTGEITVKSMSKYSIITIQNYDEYQKVTGNLTGDRQAADRQATGDRQQYKNDKECKRMVKNERGATLAPLGRFKNVLLTQSELDELKTKYPDDYQGKIERLSRYLENTGQNYRNHFSTLLDWLEQDVKPKQRRSSSYDIDELEKFNTLDDFEA